MKELSEYREKLIERLAEAAGEFCAACREADPFAKTEGDWTIHQIAAHTRDVQKFIYGERIRRTLKEENPEFRRFDADGWMAQHYKRDEPLEDILSEFAADVDEICAMLQKMPQSGWSRLSRHVSQGSELTLQLWVERSLAHIEEHLWSVENAANS
jgi:hypothetical protein